MIDKIFFIADTVTVVGNEENGIIGALAVLSLIVMILVFLGKMINVGKMCMFYEVVHVFTTLVISIFCLLFIVLGAFNAKTIIFGTYMLLASLIFVLTFMFFIIEIMLSVFGKSIRQRKMPDR